MRLPHECYQLETMLAVQFPHMRSAQHRGLAPWVDGTLLAGSACQTAILTARGPVLGRGAGHALRQRLREWLADGAAKAAPWATQLEVTACFAPLRRWVRRWWQGTELALALDATYLGDRLVVLSVRVLDRGTAIPVAWHVTAANRPGAWLAPALALLTALAPAVPPAFTVLVLADRGVWSPDLWQTIRRHRWHPLLRIRPDATFRPTGGHRVPAHTLVPGPGHAWVGRGIAVKHKPVRRAATLVVVWEAGQREPGLVLTDLAPDAVGPAWYGLRVWGELGFRALNRVGWHWERTRRTDPERVARHWLVLAVATLGTVATGTREEDAAWRGRDPAGPRVARPPPADRPPRTVRLMGRGLARPRYQLLRTRRLWPRLWLWPEPWPDPPPHLVLTVIGACHAPLPS